jgi:hypothetical protein
LCNPARNFLLNFNLTGFFIQMCSLATNLEYLRKFLAVLRIRDVYPGSRISDPGSNNSTKIGGGTFFLFSIFFSHKYHKIVNNFIFEQANKVFLAKTLRMVELFTQKFVIKPSKIWVFGSGSGKKPIPDPGSRVKKAPDPGSGSATLF